ncbi:MAG TPA: uracil-DNA glycosylase family protein [Thermomicrobiales bacterium]|nr:uracil-DNA glycosylase family protein [Thermomicrobiales bacterium]
MVTETRDRAARLCALQADLLRCRACEEEGLLARANPIAGEQGLCKILLLGQAPGARSDVAGVPFAGPSGRVLEGWLRQAGFAPGALRRDVYLTSVTRCDPGRSRSGAGDRPPSPAERALCARWWRAELALLRPAVVLLAGKMAIAEYYPPAPLEAVVGTWRREGEFRLLPLPHPSGVSRWLNDPAHRALVDRALAQLARWRVELALERPAG